MHFIYIMELSVLDKLQDVPFSWGVGKPDTGKFYFLTEGDITLCIPESMEFSDGHVDQHAADLLWNIYVFSANALSQGSASS
jgi:hypothetical protein